jgi:hypothetical protein
LINLSSEFNEETFQSFIQDFFPDFHPDKRKVPVDSDFFPQVQFLGESEALRTSVLVVQTTLGVNSRISLTKASFKILRKFGIYRALIVYLNSDQTIWRLSLLTAQPMLLDGKVIQSYSNPERHSYVLGSDVGVATARKFLLNMGSVSDFEDLKYRFSIEAINKEFYNDIASYFYDLIGRYDETGKTIQPAQLQLPGASSHIENQEYAIRLFGRVIFCWFLKEKKSSAGLPLLPGEVFDQAVVGGENILHDVLEPLFFECLNTPLDERKSAFSKSHYALVPYLNGGLFHPNEGPGGDYYSSEAGSAVNVPDEWFHKLMATLGTYNFTLDENLDFDVELSIDPEMLGRIFENLLAEINPESGESARRTTGSFYTPRRIVSHMTDISLKQYLTSKTGIDAAKIDALITIDSLDDSLFPLNESEKSAVSQALYSLKSLDPACGSGAFPIGLLQKLVFILGQIDSELELGKTKFPKNYFSGKPHLASNHDYLRKLILIRDVIHGVDIQPVAVEISKLRCFLTLIVEQEVLDHEANRGIEPLPNLDFQFVTANSLIGLNNSQSTSLWDDSRLEEELESIRQEYYSTTNKKKHLALKTKYATLVSREISLFGDSKRTMQLKTFQPFVVNSQASFFDPKSMFGIETFDLIIGNPPYVKTEHLSEEVRKELSDNYSEDKNGKRKPWVDDLYVHFIFRAFELVGQGGVVCFITNDSFVSLDSKARVRRKLLRENLIELIGCPKETFGATIYTAIFLASRGASIEKNYKGAKFTYPGFELVDKSEVSKVFVAQLPNERFVLQEDKLITKLLSQKKIGEFLRVIDCGIHSGNVREKIFSLTETPEIRNRMIQGKQIVRWAVNWDTPNAKFKYCNPDYVPSTEFGVGRGGKKSTLKEYWGFAGDVNNHFLPERVLLRQTGDSLYAAFHSEDKDGQLYTDNTLFTVVTKGEGSLLYFLGLLNSKVLNYVYHFLSSEEGKTLAQVKTGLVEQLPAVYDRDLDSQVSLLVSKIISSRRENPAADVANLENEVDSLLCKAFGLSAKETEAVLAH